MFPFGIIIIGFINSDFISVYFPFVDLFLICIVGLESPQVLPGSVMNFTMVFV